MGSALFSLRQNLPKRNLCDILFISTQSIFDNFTIFQTLTRHVYITMHLWRGSSKNSLPPWMRFRNKLKSTVQQSIYTYLPSLQLKKSEVQFHIQYKIIPRKEKLIFYENSMLISLILWSILETFS